MEYISSSMDPLESCAVHCHFAIDGAPCLCAFGNIAIGVRWPHALLTLFYLWLARQEFEGLNDLAPLGC